MAHPNIFEVNANANNISLKSLKAAFPMRGNYHFRFLTSVNVSNGNSNSNGKGVSVWMDCSDDNAVVPQNGGVFAKVSEFHRVLYLPRHHQQLRQQPSSS